MTPRGREREKPSEKQRKGGKKFERFYVKQYQRRENGCEVTGNAKMECSCCDIEEHRLRLYASIDKRCRWTMM